MACYIWAHVFRNRGHTPPFITTRAPFALEHKQGQRPPAWFARLKVLMFPTRSCMVRFQTILHGPETLSVIKNKIISECDPQNQLLNSPSKNPSSASTVCAYRPSVCQLSLGSTQCSQTLCFLEGDGLLKLFAKSRREG